MPPGRTMAAVGKRVVGERDGGRGREGRLQNQLSAAQWSEGTVTMTVISQESASAQSSLSSLGGGGAVC